MNKPVILVAGGDLRQSFLAQILAEDHTVYTTGLEKCDPIAAYEIAPESLHTLAPFDALVLPMPVTSEPGLLNAPFSAKRISLGSLLDLTSSHTAVYGGRIDDAFAEKLKSRHLFFADYLKREPLAIRNAAVTAEGAIGIAVESMPRTIDGANILVIGYGRIGRLLAQKLRLLGAHTTIAARSPDARAWAETEGHAIIPLTAMETILPQTHLLFNTVPAEVLTKSLLTSLPKDCVLIDLASLPGGFDLLCAQKLGLRSIRALSLPGKTAPYTAAAIIAAEIRAIEAERRLSHDTV